jgi:putative hemolysin
MSDDTLFLVDIDKVLREKAPNKHFPRPLVAYLKHIAHQEVLNGFLRGHQDCIGLDFIGAAIEHLGAKYEVKNLENLPKDGLYTFVSNHPLGAQDGLILGYVLGKQYNSKIKYLVNDLLMNLHGMAPFFIPINKTGKQSRNFPQMVEGGFHSDNQLIMFPAGICSRRHHGVIQDIAWKKTFITKSVETHRDVVPIHFDGRNSNFFYNLSNLCSFFKIKFNIAMMYLVDEAYKNKNKTFKITIGKPIPWQTFDSSKTPAEWAAYVRDIVYKLDK